MGARHAIMMRQRDPVETKSPGAGDYIVEKVDPYEAVFTNSVVKPLQKWIPARVTPNQITFFNVLIRFYLLYVTFPLSERPYPGTSSEFLSKAILGSFLFIFSEIVDDLDGCHARMTGQCSKLGEVSDHLADAIGLPILGMSLAFCLQSSPLWLACGSGGGLILFNFQLVHYHRTGVFTMPPISGPRASTMGMFTMLFGGLLIAAITREHWASCVVCTIVCVSSALGVASNCWFYASRLLDTKLPVWRILSDVGPMFVATTGYGMLLLMHYPDCLKTDHFFLGTDMYREPKSLATMPGRWMTPWAFTCVVVSLSGFINGGMVVNAVLKRPHPNFHPSVAVWLALMIVAHVYQTHRRSADGDGLLNQLVASLPYLCSAHFAGQMMMDFYRVTVELAAAQPAAPQIPSKTKSRAK